MASRGLAAGGRAKERPRVDVGATDVPVPDESVSPSKRLEAERERPPKRAAGHETESARQVTLDMAQLANLLEQTGQKIMKAQHDHLEARMGALEELTGKRLASAETRIGTVEGKVDSIETKLEELTKKLERQGSGQARGDGRSEERKLTLVYGGWARDTKRDDILMQLQKGLDKLGVWDHLDYPPFTTGPRRSTALSVFAPRGDETEYQVKKRMHAVVRAVADAEVVLGSGKRMFATYAKTKAERDIAGHASWVKRAVAEISPQSVRELDVEYRTGGVWMGSSFVASATNPHPPGVADQDLLWDDHRLGKAWVHVGGLARELGVSGEALGKCLEEARR